MDTRIRSRKSQAQSWVSVAWSLGLRVEIYAFAKLLLSGRPQAINRVRLVDAQTPNRLLDSRVGALCVYPTLLADQGVEFIYSKWEDHSQNAFKATPPIFRFWAMDPISSYASKP